ncbi:MAG TPA: hypothetical protein VK907_13750, partial [Phnomibacter sp.]|nr:hypothetical protein [Phnomibacter sp.]
ERFRKAGLRSYNSFIADLTKEFPKELEPAFADVILVDAPCTGSGTWARTPEQHYFFQPNDLSFFADRQKAICQNVMPGLKAGGYLIYITCAVFSRENNEVVQWLTDQLKLDLIAINVIDGTRRRSDSMFLAMLRKGQL